MDTLASMQAFLRVVQAGGFAKAAKRLGISPAMVTKHVNALEQRLAVRLLNRTTRQVSLTEAGAAYYEHCARILADIESTEASVAALVEAPKGTLRITAGVAIGDELAPLLVEYMRRERDVFPEVVLENRFVDLVEERFDVAIRGAVQLAQSSLVARPLARSTLLLCASPGYVARHGEPQEPEELARRPFLPLLHPLLKNELALRRGAERRTVTLAPAMRSNSERVLREAAMAGAGVLLLTSIHAWREIAAGRLVRVLPDWRIGSVGIYAMYPHRRHLPAKVRSFVDFMAEALGGDADRDPWMERIAAGAAG
jgi:DNA-binding transcriptional LysR family regulator